MDDQPSPTTFRNSKSDDGIRRRRTFDEPLSPRSISPNKSLPSHQPRKSSVTLTNKSLTHFDPSEHRDGEVELHDLDEKGARRSESRPKPAPSSNGRTSVERVVRFALYRSFVGGALEPPQIPDPEAPPLPTIEPDPPRGFVADFLSWIGEKAGHHSKPMLTQNIVDGMLQQFPPRAQLPVQIIDFYEDHAVRKHINLAEIESAMSISCDPPHGKPPGVVVRWIHAPLGVGLFHSSVEDIFLKGHGQPVEGHWRRPSVVERGKDFLKAGRAGWPYLETEILNVRSTKQMKEARAIARALSKDREAHRILNEKVFDGDRNPTLKNDVRWRSYHLGKGADPTYWDTVQSDLPLLLSDGALIMKSPAATKQQPSLTMSEQTLQEDPAYQYAYLARDSFRCFHRADGFLLTLSPSTGIDYLDRYLPNITRDHKGYVNHWRSEARKNEEENDSDSDKFPNDTLSVIAHIFAEFEDDGTRRWEYKNAEWLMVFLMTEIACTPHSMRSGYSIATILDAYDTQVSKLIERKFEPWARDKTAKLFQSYLKTIDELRTLGKIYEKKLDFLERLNDDCEMLQPEFDEKDADDDPNWPVITMTERVQFALRAVGDLSAQCKELHTDLTSSLGLMSRLRSIEQNDLSISADSQARAILVLSMVTVIFLPLSFLASYYGMNVRGISENPFSTTLGRFWRICGAVTAILFLLVLIFLWRVRSGNNARILATIFGKFGHDTI